MAEDTLEQALGKEPQKFEEAIKSLKERSLSTQKVYAEDPIKVSLW
jgi:hypothetical protein